MCEWKHYVHFMLIWDALCKELMSFTFSSYAPAFLHLFLSFALSAQPGAAWRLSLWKCTGL